MMLANISTTKASPRLMAISPYPRKRRSAACRRARPALTMVLMSRLKAADAPALGVGLFILLPILAYHMQGDNVEDQRDHEQH